MSVRTAAVATLLLLLPLAGCTTGSAAGPSAGASPGPVKPPPAVPDELARYKYDGSRTTAVRSTTDALAGTEYALEGACTGPAEATFVVSEAGTTTIATVTVPCDGYAHLTGVGAELPDPPLQIDLNLAGVTSAWAVLAPAGAVEQVRR
ncbi:hypothetical protein [Actinoplanes sp. RD1]|uniref:hypothetical protein n=1 Tax=Actinoplanes sp. RD1 TaxID=3064538 RepID=UPI0027426D56|nr:hypothetical protein [Actinoplanes sp. RD1]